MKFILAGKVGAEAKKGDNVTKADCPEGDGGEAGHCVEDEGDKVGDSDMSEAAGDGCAEEEEEEDEKGGGGEEVQRGGSFNKDGQKRLNVGGRPASCEMKKLSGVAGGAKSNRKNPGDARKYLSIKADDQVKMAKWLKEKMTSYPDSQKGKEDFWKVALKGYPGCEKDRLKKIMKNQGKNEKIVEKLKLGHLRDNIPKHALPTSKGFKDAGGGRKVPTEFLKMQTKAWHSNERQMGNEVNRTDIYNHFKDSLELTVNLMRGKSMREGKEMPEDELDFLDEMEFAFEKLRAHSADARNQFADRLMQKMNARTLLPSRYTMLNKKEEKKRCEITWQQMDERMWLGAFGSKDELAKWVADPASWQLHKKDTVLLFSDQVPVWIKIGHRKCVYADWEVASKTESKKRKRKRMEMHKKQAEQKSQVVQDANIENATDEGMNADEMPQAPEQKRGSEGGGDKARITLECRQGMFCAPVALNIFLKKEF